MSTSMESCDAYTHIVQEAPLKLKSDELLIQNNFPKSGKIEFVNYSVRYRPDTKMILKDINILIQPGEKVGIVGRTGSGKSTFCLCLFRIIEATNGQILIDDIDISLIGLSLLRSIITVIPQDPTLIKGSLRENLDPEGKFDDQSMIDCLKSIGMDYILEEEGLNFMVRENGENLSSGERQLICLARAIIKKNKIIIMDEATFNNDNKTELLIQQAILTKLKDTTVITISHRIKNILEYDRILVLDQGKLVEQGNPKELIEKKVGYFYNLYSHSEA
jgi:ABC-type multidrug transport system fused ATPase/permease subunit